MLCFSCISPFKTCSCDKFLTAPERALRAPGTKYFRTCENPSVCREGSKAVLRPLKPPDSTEANPLISCSHRVLNGSASLLIGSPCRYLHGQTVQNYFTRARVSLAIASSSFVGITITLTLESGVEITISFPLTLLASSSILMPR